MKSLKISIVIPSFKRVESVRQLVESIFAQTIPPFEIIVVDQNHFDLKERLSHRMRKEVVFIKQQQPNVSIARNSGALEAKGQYVLFLDDDIVLNDKNFLAKSAQVLRQHPLIKCLCPYIMQEDFSAPRLFYQYSANFLKSDDKDPSLVQIKEAGSLALFFEREYFLQTGGFDPHLFQFAGTSEDQELFFRMHIRNMPVFAHKKLVVFHNHVTPGGCELRTADYWKTREKCTRSWVLIKYILRSRSFQLGLRNKFSLFRSSFLNSRIFSRTLSNTMKEYLLLKKSMREGREFFNGKKDVYVNSPFMDHLSND